MSSISATIFYRGLLLGLAANGVGSLPISLVLHRGMSKTLGYARTSVPGGVTLDAELLEVDGDRAFGSIVQAEYLLSEGQRDLLLQIDSGHSPRAYLTVARAQARIELNALPHATWFEDLARCFAAELASRAARL